MQCGKMVKEISKKKNKFVDGWRRQTQKQKGIPHNTENPK